MNPVEAVDRRRGEPEPPAYLSHDEVRQLLDHGFHDDAIGKRDRAIVVLGIYTGRRRSELLGLTAGDIDRRNGEACYTYSGKGAKRRRRELPRPCLDPIVDSLRARGKSLDTMPPGEPLWDVKDSGFAANLRRAFKRAGLPSHGVHVLRHTAARLRRDAGASIEQVSEFLDHADIAVTARYLSRLEGIRDDGWQGVAELLDAD